jgi:3-oxosteroid 1-dehydrogenase
LSNWDYETDFLVVGSGGGLAGAITASAIGLDVLIIEKTDRIGGSTGMSGGIFWIPNNPLMQRDHVPDSMEQSLHYLQVVVGDDGGPGATPERQRAFVYEGVNMVNLLEREGVKFQRCEGYSDYYAEMRGYPDGSVRSRSIECPPSDINTLGEWADKLRPWSSAPLAVPSSEASRFLLFPKPIGLLYAARVALRMLVSSLRGQRLASNGGSIAVQLLTAVQKRKIPLWTEAALVDLIEENGVVVGATVRKQGELLRVHARRGVLIAAGGFAHNAAMRRKFGGHQANDGLWSHSNPGDTGETIEVAMNHGAAVANMDEAWWLPTFLGPNNSKWMSIPERCKPGAIIVDKSGKRYFNEAVSYMMAGKEMYKRERDVGGAVPSYLIIDSRNRSKYMFTSIMPGAWPKEWLDGGYVKQGATLAELAANTGIDAVNLEATVERFNHFADTGNDEDFYRGEGAHERWWGDPDHKPNPCLGRLDKAPFYAIPIYPGDVGTCGGLVCNAQAQVLREDGSPIAGLYAAGNCTASVMGRTYPGAGASVGASSVFSYVAAHHAARVNAPQGERAASPA